MILEEEHVFHERGIGSVCLNLTAGLWSRACLWREGTAERGRVEILPLINDPT